MLPDIQIGSFGYPGCEGVRATTAKLTIMSPLIT
jgi:Na+-translocating ferredoxin:NAD+ oxidoreductase RNF subunit RnfB